jgi:protein TonB
LTPRDHLRKQVIPPSYIDLGKSNGGILVNVSEGGLSLTAALPLADAHFSCMRLQLPYCSGWIEAKGQIAWRSESGKTAGIRFVELGEEAQQQIKNWIYLEVRPSRAQEQIQKVRQAQNLRVASLILGPQDCNEVFQADSSAEPYLPEPVSNLQEVTFPVTASRAPKPAGIPPAEGVQLGARNYRRDIGAVGQKWRSIGTIAGLIVLITFTVGRIARNLDVRNKVTAAVALQERVASEAGKSETSLPERRVTEAPMPGGEEMSLQAETGEPLLAEKHQTSDAPTRNLPRQVRSVEHSSPASIVKRPKLPPEKAPAPVQMTKEPTFVAASVNGPPLQTAQPQQVGSLPPPPAQPEANMASRVSAAPGPPKDASPVDPKKNESSPSSAKLPESAANKTGFVAIHTDPYPSLRIPTERNSKKSSQGKSLQFGHLVSRAEPVYPEEAKQRGIEGTVKLHAVFGRDGAVESLSSISGSPALMAAAMNAVRGWHYSQTLLDNKSVEIEEDISVEFRLSNSAAARN